MKCITIIIFAANFFAFTGKAQNSPVAPDSSKGLKDYYKSYFLMGVAVGPQSLKGADSALIVLQFNSLTAENAMKMGPIHPKENEYYWKDADAIVDFAVKHGMKIRGHNLLWHQQTPGWLFTDNGKTVTKEVLLKRLKDHITAVVSRYKGKIYAWDVVNEAIADDSSQFYRNSLWYQICGEDFIPKAFEYAHAADPAAILFYNDYNEAVPHKRERIYQLIKKLLEAKVPVHAIGLQAHYSLQKPGEKDLRDAIERYASLGVKLQITELDISVHPDGSNRSTAGEGVPVTFTPEMEQQQIEQYKRVFAISRNYKNVISGVTFWNVSDRNSWLDNFPVRGRKNYPLLFDTNRQPKKAYWEVVRW